LRLPCPEDQTSLESLLNLERKLTTFIFQRGSIGCGRTYMEMLHLELWTANVNLEIAALLQYIPIWAFLMMVIEYFEFFNAVSDKDLRDNFYIDQAVYVDETGLKGKLELDVTEKVMAGVQQNGARNITGGRSLTKLLPEIRSGFTNYLQVTRGPRVQKLYEHQIPLCCCPRRRFNVARLDPVFDYYFTIKTAGLLGVWVYIAIGILRSIFGLSFRFLTQWHNLRGKFQEVQHEEDTIYHVSEAICNLTTAVCIINMIFVLRNQDLVHPDALGNSARLKFFSTAGLLMILQLQPWSLRAFKGGPHGQSHMSKLATYWDGHLDKDNMPEVFLNVLSVARTSLSPVQEKLTHASLLCGWCVLFALLNCIFWAGYPTSKLMDEPSPDGYDVLEDGSKKVVTVAEVTELLNQVDPAELSKIHAILRRSASSSKARSQQGAPPNDGSWSWSWTKESADEPKPLKQPLVRFKMN